jgi:LmbE family N-acetylglucosaminyl deacetylase
MLSAVIIIVGMIAIFFASMWLAIALALEDFSVPLKNALPYKNVLFIYPHPDDEHVSGGLSHVLSQGGARTTLLLLTKGERGTPDASLRRELKSIRTHEVTRSAKILGFSELIVEDMGDNTLKKKKAALKKKIGAVMRRVHPDLVVTYDRSGLYGHPDHMVVSDVITELYASQRKKTTLWYLSFSKYIFSVTKLPTHMATNKTFMTLRAAPTHRIWIGPHVLAKLRSLYSHQSQLPAFKKSIPGRLPLWYVHSARLFEYYAVVS